MSLRANSAFRHDINGLRAWAVMVVVLYHFGVPGFGGGFVGVDVFFVISGFLMTSIIIGGLDRPLGVGWGFSLFAFYLARARRILPALLALCAGLLAVGWFAMPSSDYKTLATHTLTSLAFVSNIKFWREAGYFDAASYDKWLLHTWSLSVEWQFYLLLPVALMVVWRFWPGRRNALIAVVLALLASLALSLILTPLETSGAFFLLPTRSWEMLAGGVVYLFGPHVLKLPRRLLEMIGFGLILVSVATAQAAHWPGYQAVLPVLGSCLVLAADRAQSAWTSPAPMQVLGRWSYSIYLWHWPVVVALVYLERQHQPTAILLSIVLSVLLGGMSYRWVESPARTRIGLRRQKSAWLWLSATALVVALPALTLRLANGAPGRMPAAVELAANEANNYNTRRTACHIMGGKDFQSCVYGGPNVRVILMGDSHVSSVVTAVQAALPGDNDGVLAFSYTSCPTLFGVRSPHPDRHCAAFNEWVMTQIKDLPVNVPLVVVNRSSGYVFGDSHISSATPSPPSIYFGDTPPTRPTDDYLRDYAQHLIDSACQIAEKRPVYLVRPFPEMTVDVPRLAARKLLIDKPLDIAISLKDYHARHAFIWTAQDQAANTCGANILDPLPWLCADGQCSGTDSGRPRYYDDNHLSEFGNRALVGMFEAVTLAKR